MTCKWLLFIALSCGSVQAAPTNSEPLTQERLADIVHERGLGANLQSMGHSVASNTSSLINTAMGMIGIPYRFGGTSAETGFDCSGFVRAIYQDTVGHLLPRRADEQAKATQKIDKKELRPGDLVFFNTMRRTFSHVGIYVGEGKFIHSPRKGKSVRVESMNDSYWAKRFNGARRVDVADAQPALLEASTAP
ncbi:C40 family peptidase [Comamonas aquatica]|jgi:cell wall-associated NlpC family hydrolase|uniref:Gamma-DL-glutamyl hydrolase n=1 Tax=Comamonas aquatica TaxID=225991 RepID=A0AA35D9I8_9BURK|nr:MULTISPECIES: C40 family peptidase [Comamonas]MDH0493946.1 C40 family peptidase [Comamonas aquatica]MDH1903938.1 C40 family peptidase [Comamonas aquatica]MRT19094.1 NlpC/P60 family protein [Comamonas sp. CAH-2]WBM43767.1 C40 family peptidase [Comamonas aquatica]CAB5650587.1 Gamma-DL-glutamyl hydrolase precursor [Comamonas aquatica]